MDIKVRDNFNIGTDFMMRVGDAWVGKERRETMQVINPSSGQPIADVPVATDEDAQAALEAARSAQRAWAALTQGERAVYLERVARAGARRRRSPRAHRFARGRQADARIPRRDRGLDRGLLRVFRELRPRRHGEILPSDNRGEEIAIRKVPYGVCVGITPWNFPSAMVARKVAPALYGRQHHRGEAQLDHAALGTCAGRRSSSMPEFRRASSAC